MKLRRSILVVLIALAPVAVSVGDVRGQDESPAAKEKKLLDEYKAAVVGKVMAGSKQRPQVLLLGTFHFQDAGLDENGVEDPFI